MQLGFSVCGQGGEILSLLILRSAAGGLGRPREIWTKVVKVENRSIPNNARLNAYILLLFL